MNTRAWLWAFFPGIPGLREIALVVLVTVLLYGRAGLQVARRGGGLPPWLLPVVRRTAPSAARTPPRSRSRSQPQPDPPAVGTALSRRGDRVFWFLAIVAATAVAAWVVTRTLIVGAPKLSP
jgi:hypothetical protein